MTFLHILWHILQCSIALLTIGWLEYRSTLNILVLTVWVDPTPSGWEKKSICTGTYIIKISPTLRIYIKNDALDILQPCWFIYLSSTHFSFVYSFSFINLFIYLFIDVIVMLIGWNSAPWWRHQMEPFSLLLAICAGNSPVTNEFSFKRPVTRSFDVSLMCARINGWVNNCEAGDLRRHHIHYVVTVMSNLKTLS